MRRFVRPVIFSPGISFRIGRGVSAVDTPASGMFTVIKVAAGQSVWWRDISPSTPPDNELDQTNRSSDIDPD